jgi:hypothetical protein
VIEQDEMVGQERGEDYPRRHSASQDFRCGR